MFKQSVKNYFQNLKFVLTPLGAIALGVVLGLSICLPIVMSAVNAMFDSVLQLFQGLTLDVDAFGQSVLNSFAVLNWDNLQEAVSTIFSIEWVNQTLTTAIEASLSSAVSYAAQIDAVISDCVAVLVVCAVVFALIVILSIVAGFILTKFLIRRSIAKRSLKNFLIAIGYSLAAVLFLMLCLWLATVWVPSVIFSALFLLFMSIFGPLLQAYVVHGRGKVKFRQVVNAKNFLKMILSHLLIYVISFVFLLLCIAITNVAAGAFIGISFVLIAAIVVGLNAEAYVKNLAESADSPQTLPYDLGL